MTYTFFIWIPSTPRSTLFPYTTLFRSRAEGRRSAPRVPGFHEPERDGLDLLARSEEHTYELQSHHDIVCRLLRVKKRLDMQVCWRAICCRRYHAQYCAWVSMSMDGFHV